MSVDGSVINNEEGSEPGSSRKGSNAAFKQINKNWVNCLSSLKAPNIKLQTANPNEFNKPFVQSHSTINDKCLCS